MRRLSLLLFLLFVLFSPTQAQLADGFQDEVILGPWEYPSGIVFDDNGQGYLWDNIGRVYVIDSSGVVINTPLIDIAEEVERFINHGLLGFALDPDFLQNGYIYLLYTVDRYYLLNADSPDYDPNQSQPYRGTIGRISRYTADIDNNFQSIIPTSRKVLLGEEISDGFPLIFDSHALGSLVFGVDGSLLASCGDAASSLSTDLGSNNDTYYQDGLETGIIRPDENVGAYRSQMLSSLSGKIIRIDPETGDGLATNPYFDANEPRSAASRLWSLGLRNPYRMCYVPNTGGHDNADPGWFLVGDVGLGAWEEINLVNTAGQNFGWPLFEGFERQPEYSDRLTYDQNYPLAGDGCDGYTSFQQMMGILVQDGCQTEAPQYVHSTPRMAYRNKWNDISVPTIIIAQDSSINAPGVRPNALEFSFEGEDFQGDASIAGVFYEGTRFPEAYQGAYFQADYRDWIRVLRMDEEGNFRSVDSFYHGIEKLVHIAYNPYDEWLYAITIDDRKLHKISYGGPRRPKAVITADKLWGDSPLQIQFDATASQGNGSPLTYQWVLGEDMSSQVMPSYTFSSAVNAPSNIVVSLVVRDTAGFADSSSVIVSLNNRPPEVSILTPRNNMQYPTGQTTAILATASVEDRESNPEELSYRWSTLLYHEDHFHPGASSEQPISQFILSPYGCVEDQYWYELILEVTDPQGLTGMDKVILEADCGDDWLVFKQILAERNNPQTLQLRWETSLEVGLEDFVIEYSSDFQQFYPLAIVAAENSLGGANYSTTIPQEANEIEVIRLRGRSNRPAFRLSPLVIVQSLGDFATIYPNPGEQDLYVNIDETASQFLRVYLYNGQGQQVGYTFREVNIGEALEWQIPLGHLPNGLYFYQIEDGPRRQVGKWLKQ